MVLKKWVLTPWPPCTHSHFWWPAHLFTWSKGCWNISCWKVCRCACISHKESLESEWQKKSPSCDINSQPLWVLSPALWRSWAVNLGSFHWVGIFIVVTICGIVLGVLRYSLHQLFALKYFVGELLLLRNGARWTVLRSKVLTLSADHGTSSGTQSSSSSVFLHHQPDNSGGKGHSRACGASPEKPTSGSLLGWWI